MLSVKTARNSALNEILSYTYPKLHTGACWFVGFYAYDPAKGVMRRKRIKINSVGTNSEKRRYAAQVCHRFSAKLEAGWNPWVEAEADNTYKLFSDVLTHYRSYIKKLQDDGVLRKSTVHGYNCSAGIMERWNDKQTIPIRYIYQFDRSFCVRFLNYVYVERGNTATTRNNNLAFLREFSTFLVDHLYLKNKPTEGMQTISKGSKKNRTVIAPDDMRRLHDWLVKNNRPFLLVCYFLHYMLIRPKEICRLRLRDINMAKQTVYIDGQISKNKKSGVVTIPVPILELLVDLEYFNAPTSYYIFSTGFRPGPKFCSERHYRDFWKNDVASALKFPKEYKFYSLKDSGITAMFRAGLDALSVKEQARHSSLSTTTAYTPQEVVDSNPRLKGYKGIL